MSIQNFMSPVWSECLYQEMKRRYVGVANCTHHYTKELCGKSSTLKICGLDPVEINDYTPNTDIPAPQELSDFCKTLTIDKSKYFNFQIDDIEKAQTDANIMKLALDNASNALANAADKHVFSLYKEAGNQVLATCVDENTILDHLIEARIKLFNNNVANTSDIIVEVAPWIAALLFKAKITMLSDTNPLVESGYIGNILGCKVYVSSNIEYGQYQEGSPHAYNCLMRTRRSIAFLDGFSEIVAYRPENRFSEAIKGLYFYGAKVVYPKEVVHMALTLT